MDTTDKKLIIIGGGLAGTEAAWQATRLGCQVTLHEMKPVVYSPAHHSSLLAELVCSNSFRSDTLNSAVGLLKQEMRDLGSLIMKSAEQSRVPAGKALAVDREKFARFITEKIEKNDNITVVRDEVKELPKSMPESCMAILATGPLTSEPLAVSLGKLTGQDRLAFYDAIAPIVLSFLRLPATKMALATISTALWIKSSMKISFQRSPRQKRCRLKVSKTINILKDVYL
jgi:methylenetetrahydrofolate--tRNA-(uracil-5-)-methyltransferase